jgi:thiamine-monophosphate kinase
VSKLSDLGEKEVVRKILARVATIESGSVVGPGDDAAAVDMGLLYLVASTDIVLERTHMMKGMSHKQLGWMVAAVNFSDIAAMGAKPIGLVVSMGLPRDLEFDLLDQIFDGILDCCESVKGEMLGGDTKEASEITLAGAALGTVSKRGILLRKGARPGDLLAVTGTMGLAAAGFHSLMHNLTLKKAEKAALEPVPRVKEGLVLSASGMVTSCMDISDGLASSVHALSEASQVAFEVDYSAIPVEKEVAEVTKATGIGTEEMVLYYGGDYQLLFTFKPEGLGILRSRLGSTFSVIGKAKMGSENLLIKGGKTGHLEKRGYEHFT